MDGNHSDDEYEFVNALKAEMPVVDDELVKLVMKVDDIEEIIDNVHQTRDKETMKTLRSKIQNAEELLEEKESLLVKLEPEIVQWDPQDKLTRRDEELDFVYVEGTGIQERLQHEDEFCQDCNEMLHEQIGNATAGDKDQIRETKGKL